MNVKKADATAKNGEAELRRGGQTSQVARAEDDCGPEECRSDHDDEKAEVSFEIAAVRPAP